MDVFIQVRDSEKPGHYRVWKEIVENGQSVSAETLCPCPKGHKTPDAARSCSVVKKALKALEAGE